MRRAIKIFERIFLVLIILLLLIVVPIGVNKLFEVSRAAFLSDKEKMMEDIDRMDYLLRHDFANLGHFTDLNEYTKGMEEWRNRVESDESYILDSFRIDVVKRIAGLRDPHSIVYNYQNLDEKTFPYRLEWYDSSFYLINARVDDDKWLGSRVIRLGEYSSQKVYEKLNAYANAPNPSGQAYFIRLFTSIPVVLQHEGIINTAGEVSMLVENSSGEQKELVFTAIPADGIGALSDYKRLSSKYAETDLPLREQQPERFYWYTFLEPENAVYLRYRRSESQGDIETFWQSLFEEIDSKHPDKFIIDIRDNPGGDSQNHVTLLDEIQERNWLNAYGKLFLLTNRGTGSAAISLTSEMEMSTEAIQVGEAPMDRASTTSDPTFFTLPHSKMTLLLPNIYSLHSFAGDPREEITPDWEFSDNPFQDGFIRDLALDSIFQSSIDPSSRGHVVSSLPEAEGSFVFNPLRNMRIFPENDTVKIHVDGMGEGYIYERDSVYYSSRYDMELIIDTTGTLLLKMNTTEFPLHQTAPGESSIYELMVQGKTEGATNKLQELQKEGAYYVTRPIIQTWTYKAYKRDGLESALALNTVNKALFPGDPVISIVDYELYQYAGGDFIGQSGAIAAVLGKLIRRYFTIVTTDRVMNDEYNAFIGTEKD